jgi:hypothetical protein
MLNLSLLADIEEEVVNEQPAPTEAEITEDAKAEVAQAEEGGDIEVKDTEVLAESQILSAQFDKLLAMQNHITKYGVDRTFLALFNRGNKLSRALGVDIPACESVDAVGYPTSALSVACLEAFGHKEKGVVAKIVDFIVALMHKIKNLAARFWTWLTGLLDNQATKWLKLQRITKNRIVDKNVGSDIIVPAIGAEFDANLGERFLRMGILDMLTDAVKDCFIDMLTDAVKDCFKLYTMDIFTYDISFNSTHMDRWTDSTNARKLAEQIAIVEQNMAKTAAVTGKNAGATLKRLASNIRIAFWEMDEVKKALGVFNEKVKTAEDAVTKAMNSIEKTINLTGNKKAVVAAKNALIDLKARQSTVQKVASIYTRCIRVMLRSYAKVLFTFTIEK